MNLSEYNDYRDRSERLKKVAAERLYDDIVVLAGSLSAVLYDNVNSAAQLLGHELPNVRIAAIRVLVHFWGVNPTMEIAQTIRAMARSDAAANVRHVAMCSGSTIFAGTDDVELGGILARKVLDDQDGSVVREEAYHALRRLQHKWLKRAMAFSFPHDVDWPFVYRFLDTTRAPEPQDSFKNFVEMLRRGEKGRKPA